MSGSRSKREVSLIDRGLAVLCSEEFRREHGPVYSYEAMAAACGCSPQRMQAIVDATIAKIRIRLLERGVDRDAIGYVLQHLDHRYAA